MAAVSAAQAQVACPSDTTVGTVMAPGFSCVLGDKTFSAFDVTGVPSAARVQFGILNNELFAVTLSRDGAFFSDGRSIFDYTITAASPNHFVQGSVGIDVSFPTVLTTVTMNGQLLGPITDGGTQEMLFGPGVSSVVVDNTMTISGPAELNSVTDDFTQVMVGIPEPASLSLFGLGLLGIGLTRRRG
jgi:hypothetical protein